MVNINVYPEKNKDIIVRWVVEYTDKNGNEQKLFKESEDKALKTKEKLESEDTELNELVNDETGGLISGDKPNSVGAGGSSQITSKSTTDDYITTSRQGMSRAMMYRGFYGENVEPEIPKVKEKTKQTLKNKNQEIQEVDKTVEALGSIYAQSTDPIDFENKAKLVGYTPDEIEVRQEKFFRKTSDDQKKTHNPKIPLEEIDIVEDVLTKKQSHSDIVTKTQNQQISNEYSIPYYDQLKQKNPLLARKLLYLIDMVIRENVDENDKSALIWQFLNGIGANNINQTDKNYIIKFIQNGK